MQLFIQEALEANTAKAYFSLNNDRTDRPGDSTRLSDLDPCELRAGARSAGGIPNNGRGVRSRIPRCRTLLTFAGSSSQRARALQVKALTSSVSIKRRQKTKEAPQPASQWRRRADGASERTCRIMRCEATSRLVSLKSRFEINSCISSRAECSERTTLVKTRPAVILGCRVFILRL